MKLIAAPPEILHPSSGQTIFVKEKDEIKINCEADGQPKPHVIWTKVRLKNKKLEKTSLSFLEKSNS